MNNVSVSGTVKEFNLSYTPKGLAVSEIVIINKFGDKQSEITGTVFGETAERLAQIEFEGVFVSASGYLNTRENKTKTGSTFRNTQFIISNIEYQE